MSDVEAALAVTKRYVDAWIVGDFPAMIATYDDDFVLHWFGQNAYAGAYRGKAEVIAALIEFTRRTGRRLVGITDIMAGKTRTVVIARESMAADGETREVERVLVYRVADERLAECWVYDSDQRFIDKALIGPLQA